MCKSRLIKGFGENVSQLSMGINVAQIDVAFLRMVTKKVKANINMLGPRMQHRILVNSYGIRAITKQRHLMKIQAKSHKVDIIHNNCEQQLAAVTYSAYVVV